VRRRLYPLPLVKAPVTCLVLFLLIFPAILVSGGSTGGEERYREMIDRIAGKHRIPASLVRSIIRAESGYDPWAVSVKGAMGLMQLMPQTAVQYGVENPFDPEQNIEGGVKYLADLIKLYEGDTRHVLAAYNAGQEAIRKYGGIPPYPETRNYIQRVMSRYSSSKIPTRTVIYAFHDDEGRLVLTNNRALWEKHRK